MQVKVEQARGRTEAEIQDDIRNALAGVPGVMTFRANVIGEAWVGKIIDNVRGRVVLGDARRVTSGLPPGFSDIFGLYYGVFFAIEVKTAKGKPSAQQQQFIAAVKNNGGRAGVARSVEDAVRIVLGL